MSQFEQIDTFVKVIENNSFAQAAKLLGISPAAVSKQINALEKRLAVQLLKRTTRKLVLTNVGENYYQQCRRVLSELHEADALVSHVQKEPTGELCVAATSYFGARYIVPYVAEFMALYPKVILHLELAERFPDLSRENIDILVGISLEGQPNLVRRKIGSAHYVLCATPKYLKKYGTPKKPIDLLQHHYIEHEMRVPSGLMNFKGGQSIKINPILFLNNTKEMLACALQDIGIIKVHQYAACELVNQKKLCEVLPEYRDTAKNVYLFYQHSRFVQPKIRHFIDFLIKKVEKDTKL